MADLFLSRKLTVPTTGSVSHPTSPIWPLYQGLTCLPTGRGIGNDNCTLGGYASYSVNVSSVEHIQLVMKFARDTNVRLVIKNTGHDFAAKSMGAGALSIWTHNLDDIVFIKDYEYVDYQGPAFKLGAGVMVYQIYEAAEKEGVSVVGGLCWVSFLTFVLYFQETYRYLNKS